GATAYRLDVGTGQGQGNIFGQVVGLATSQTVNNIPTTGATIYVRLSTQINGAFQFNDYTYTSFIPPSQIPPVPTSTSPSSGNLTTQSFTFSFNAPNGFNSLNVVDVLINNALDGRHACYVAFVPATTTLGSVYLVDDAGNAGGPYQGL